MDFNALIPELAVTDCVKSLRFYRDILGFTVAYQRPEEGFAFLQYGQAQLMVDQIDLGRTFEDCNELKRSLLGLGLNFQIQTDSLDRILKNLAGHKIALYLAPEEKWYRHNEVELGQRQFVVADPDGYLLRFFQPLGERRG